MSVFVIAEIGNTHEGSVGLAKCFIKAAAECGVDAVKFQTHMFEAESLPDAPNPPYFSGESRKEYFERTAFTLDQYRELKDYAERECGVEFMSSPFSVEAVDLLEKLGVKSYKIPSGEVTNLLLLEKVAETGKRVLLSSGMSTWAELDEAVNVLTQFGCADLVVMQCTSMYPCPPEKSGLNLLAEYRERYSLPVGYSDHTMGIAVPVCAVMAGAVVVEKHFTLSQLMYGSDAKNSTEPEEFRLLVEEIRNAALASAGCVDKDAEASGLESMKHIFEKSIVSLCDISQGTVIDGDMLAMKKPGIGMSAKRLSQVIGARAARDIEKDAILSEADFVCDG